MEGIECANCLADVDTTTEVTRIINDKQKKELWCLACVHREMQDQLKDEAIGERDEG